MNVSKTSSKKVIGIDLGTTNSCVSINEGGKFKAIESEEGSRTTPSVVSYTKKEKLVGIHAKRQAFTNVENTIFAAKRLIGRKYSEISDEDKRMFPYKIVSFGKNDEVGIELNIDGEKKVISPVTVGADVLYKMKKIAESYLGDTVTDAVITVPAYFNDHQRQATKDAGRIAGLNVLRIINEPTAACMSYGMDKNKTGNIAVFDLGGGTFDVSILEVDKVDNETVYSVKATDGDTHLGGEDFDNIIVNYIVNDFRAREGIDLKDNITALFRIKEAAEVAKKELSSMFETNIKIPFITEGPKHIDINLKRSEFEKLSEHLIQKTLDICKRTLEASGLAVKDLTSLILVGGMTRMPLVQKRIEEFFKIQPSKDINPDECVAIGAAIQGSIIKGDVSDMVLVDVTPLSLGIETKDDVFAILIPRNSSIPVTEKNIFTTASDYQPHVLLRVYQGERSIASENTCLGEFTLSGIESAPAGEPKIEVSFSIDVNGIVNVTAKDLKSNQSKGLSIKTADAGLTEEDIKRMVEEAEKYKAEDEARIALIRARNNLYTSLNRLKTLAELPENANAITAEMSSKLQVLYEKVKDVDKSTDIDFINNLNSDILSIISAFETNKKSSNSTNNDASSDNSNQENLSNEDNKENNNEK